MKMSTKLSLLFATCLAAGLAACSGNSSPDMADLTPIPPDLTTSPDLTPPPDLIVADLGDGGTKG